MYRRLKIMLIDAMLFLWDFVRAAAFIAFLFGIVCGGVVYYSDASVSNQTKLNRFLLTALFTIQISRVMAWFNRE